MGITHTNNKYNSYNNEYNSYNNKWCVYIIYVIRNTWKTLCMSLAYMNNEYNSHTKNEYNSHKQ
jgi:hypothetical protein